MLEVMRRTHTYFWEMGIHCTFFATLEIQNVIKDHDSLGQCIDQRPFQGPSKFTRASVGRAFGDCAEIPRWSKEFLYSRLFRMPCRILSVSIVVKREHLRCWIPSIFDPQCWIAHQIFPIYTAHTCPQSIPKRLRQWSSSKNSLKFLNIA